MLFFIDMNIYLYIIYYMWVFFKTLLQCTRKQLFTSTKMMLLMIFFARAFCSTRNTPPVYWTTLDSPRRVSQVLQPSDQKRTQRRILPEKMGKTQRLEGLLPETTKVRPLENRPFFRKGSKRKESSSTHDLFEGSFFYHPMFQGRFCCFQGG